MQLVKEKQHHYVGIKVQCIAEAVLDTNYNYYNKHNNVVRFMPTLHSTCTLIMYRNYVM